MLRTISLLLLLILSACGGSSGSGSTIGTIGTTSATRAVVTTTTLPPQPPALDELVISIDRMPDGWVQVDDMSGPVGLDAFDPSLIDSLSDVGIVNGYRVTFARSATSEVAALASSGAELIVSLALEMDDEEAAQSAISTIESSVSGMLVTSRPIRTPGAGIRLELTGGIFLMAWSVDQVVQVLVANGAPAGNIVNIADLVPDVD